MSGGCPRPLGGPCLRFPRREEDFEYDEFNMTDPQNRNLPALPFSNYGMTYYAPNPAPQESEPEETTVPFSHYLWILKRQRWKILAFVLTCVLATLVVAKRLTPSTNPSRPSTSIASPLGDHRAGFGPYGQQ